MVRFKPRDKASYGIERTSLPEIEQRLGFLKLSAKENKIFLRQKIFKLICEFCVRAAKHHTIRRVLCDMEPGISAHGSVLRISNSSAVGSRLSPLLPGWAFGNRTRSNAPGGAF